MSLFDFLKRKKQVEKAKEKKSEEQTSPSVSGAEDPETKKRSTVDQSTVLKKSKRKGGFSYDVVKEPHVSEKAAYLAEKNQYIFKVFPNCNKKEIKKAVEGVYGVDVLSVNMIKIPAKKRRLGKIQGYKKGHIKAVVKIKEGQKIEIL